MADAAGFKSSEERVISRGGKNTALWILALSLFFIAGGIAVALLVRDRVSPPARPGTTSATTTAGETKPPSPGSSD